MLTNLGDLGTVLLQPLDAEQPSVLVLANAPRGEDAGAADFGDDAGTQGAVCIEAVPVANNPSILQQSEAHFGFLTKGEYVAIQSVSCGKLLQARRKHPPLVVYSTMAGVWEQWHVSTELSQQGHAIAHRFTNRQLPSVELLLRVWRVSEAAPLALAAQQALAPPVSLTTSGNGLGHSHWVSQSRPAIPSTTPSAQQHHVATLGHPKARLQLAQYAGTRVNSSASSVLHGPASTSGGLNHHQQHQGSLQDDVLELSHRVVRGFVARLTRAPLYITFRLWAALARRSSALARELEARAQHRAVHRVWRAWRAYAGYRCYYHRLSHEAMMLQASASARHLGRVLRGWHAYTVRSAALRQLGRLVAAASARARAAAVLRAWQRATERTRGLENMMHVRAAHRLQARALHSWHSALQQTSQKQDTAEAAASRHVARQLHRVLSGWAAWARQNGRLAQIGALLAARRSQATLQAYLHAWHQRVQAVAAGRAASDRMWVRWRRQLQADVLDVWQASARRQRRVRHLQLVLTCRLERLNMRHAFHQWLALARARTAMEQSLAQKLGPFHPLRLSMQRWRAVVSQNAALRATLSRAMKLRARRVQRACFLGWRARAARAQEAAGQLVQVCLSAWLRHWLQAWAQAASRRHYTAACVARAHSLVALRLLSGSFFGWKDAAESARHDAFLDAAADTFARKKLRDRCRGALYEWSHLAGAVRVANQMAQRQQHRRVAQALQQWHRWAAAHRQRSDAAGLLCQFRSTRCQRAVLLSWRALAVQRNQVPGSPAPAFAPSAAAMLSPGWQGRFTLGLLSPRPTAGHGLPQYEAGCSTPTRTAQPGGGSGMVVPDAKTQDIASLLGLSPYGSSSSGSPQQLFVNTRAAGTAQHEAGPPTWLSAYSDTPAASPLQPSLPVAPATSVQLHHSRFTGVLAPGAATAAAVVAGRRCRRVLRAWHVWAARKRRHTSIVTAAAARTSRRLVVACWNALSSYRDLCVTAHAAADKRFAALGLQLLAGTFSAWRGLAWQMARVRNAAQCMAAVRGTTYVGLYFAAWKGLVAQRRAGRRRLMQMGVAWDRSLMSDVVSAWHQVTVSKVSARALAAVWGAAASKAMARAAFLGWWQLARVKAGHSRAVAQHLGARHARSLCTVVLHAWHDLASSLARERRDFPLLCRVFYAWLTLTQEQSGSSRPASAPTQAGGPQAQTQILVPLLPPATTMHAGATAGAGLSQAQMLAPLLPSATTAHTGITAGGGFPQDPARSADASLQVSAQGAAVGTGVTGNASHRGTPRRGVHQIQRLIQYSAWGEAVQQEQEEQALQRRMDRRAQQQEENKRGGLSQQARNPPIQQEDGPPAGQPGTSSSMAVYTRPPPGTQQGSHLQPPVAQAGMTSGQQHASQQMPQDSGQLAPFLLPPAYTQQQGGSTSTALGSRAGAPVLLPVAGGNPPGNPLLKEGQLPDYPVADPSLSCASPTHPHHPTGRQGTHQGSSADSSYATPLPYTRRLTAARSLAQGSAPRHHHQLQGALAGQPQHSQSDEHAYHRHHHPQQQLQWANPAQYSGSASECQTQHRPQVPPHQQSAHALALTQALRGQVLPLASGPHQNAAFQLQKQALTSSSPVAAQQQLEGAQGQGSQGASGLQQQPPQIDHHHHQHQQQQQQQLVSTEYHSESALQGLTHHQQGQPVVEQRVVSNTEPPAPSSSSPYSDIQAKLAKLEALSLARLKTRRHHQHHHHQQQEQQTQQVVHPHGQQQAVLQDRLNQSMEQQYPAQGSHLLHPGTQARFHQESQPVRIPTQVAPAGAPSQEPHGALPFQQWPFNPLGGTPAPFPTQQGDPHSSELQLQEAFHGGDAIAALTVHASPQQGSVVHDPLLEGYSRLLSSCAGLESAVTKMWATDTAATISWDSESGGVVVEEKRIPAWQQALVVSQDPSKRLQGEAVLEELAIDSKALQARLAVQVLITQQQEAERSRRWE